MALIRGTGAGGGQPLKKKKKKAVEDSWSAASYVPQPKPKPSKPTKAVPPQNMDSLYNARRSVGAFPFKDIKGPKYASESKRLIDSLGIKLIGMEEHPDPNAVYTAIGQALHRLPAAAWPWLDKHGSSVNFQVAKDGLVAGPTSVNPKGVIGYYDGGITVGVPNEKEAYGGREFQTPSGEIVSRSSLTGDRVKAVVAHEFAHWVDKSSNKISEKHPELFGSNKSWSAPHDKRQWERFANDFESYISSPERRKMMDPNVAKFFDRFIGPQLSVDNTSQSKGVGSHATANLVKRIAAIKSLHALGQLGGTPDEIGNRLLEIEKKVKGRGF